MKTRGLHRVRLLVLALAAGLSWTARAEFFSFPTFVSTGACRFGNGGSDTSVLICPDGISFRGPDGIYRRAGNGGAPSAGPSPDFGSQLGLTSTVLTPGPATSGYGSIDDTPLATFVSPPPPSHPITAPDHEHDHGSSVQLGVPVLPTLPNRPVARTISSSDLARAHSGLPRASGSLRNILGKCVSCHVQHQELHVALKSVDTLTDHLPYMSESLLQTMMARSRLTADEILTVKDHVAEAHKVTSHERPRGYRAPSCYLTDEDRLRRAATLPQVEKTTSALASQFASASAAGNFVFYDRSFVPRAWQESTTNGQIGKIMTANNASNPYMYQRMGYNSDGAREFPWLHSAGTDLSPDASSEKFFIPPPGGEMARIVTRNRANSPDHYGRSTNVNGPDLGWQYGAGAVVGEVLRVKGVPFEVRLRRKFADGTWQMDVLRPFESPADLARGLRRLCEGDGAPSGCRQVKASGAISQLEHPQARVYPRTAYINARNFGTARDPLSLSRTALESTQPSASLHVLPDLPPDVVRELLTKTPFKSVFGKPWISGSTPGWAPTSNSDFNIVPRNYFAAFIPMTQNGCMKCHSSAGRHVDQFEPYANQMYAPAPDDAPRPRTWYNKIPGDDGILSFHPFDARAVSQGAPAWSGSLDRCLLQNRLFR